MHNAVAAEIKEYILDLLFPRSCLGCGLPMDSGKKGLVCRKCLDEIDYKNDFACAFCFAPVVEGKTCPLCKRDYSLDRLLVATDYSDRLIANMVKLMKYHFIRSLADDMGQLMSNFLKSRNKILGDGEHDLLVIPVPLHKRKLNWRGFNQSEILARKIALSLKLEMDASLLKRSRLNKPQAEIKSRDERLKNISGAFGLTLDKNSPVKSPLAGKRILLVDDVSTTGATLNECSAALKGGGAKEVIGFVFARNN